VFRARGKTARGVDTMLAGPARFEAIPLALEIVDQRSGCLKKVGFQSSEISWAYGIKGCYGLQSQKLINRGCTWGLTLGG